MTLHPATRKAHLRAFLTQHPVATTVQLERAGLTEPMRWLDLPQVTYTCRTRTMQPHSETDLTFVALQNRTLGRPPRELMHDAALTEIRLRLAQEDPRLARYGWHVTTARGRERGNRPDAELRSPNPDRRSDYAVEVDAGYSQEVRLTKIEAFGEMGYSGVIWATTVHARTRTVPNEALTIRHLKLRTLMAYFIDFWSANDPYRDRPRCHKWMVHGW
ncbi:hypothetical protein [Deinococcus sp. NW-56]|uniref:hypothetical protein n=1 Tax=Deinococcus sp. NW-56 TaxID=2080419 RepID=UPI000CF4F464|nr:hypothetical protein [Deinococcus sp. NW-56]